METGAPSGGPDTSLINSHPDCYAHVTRCSTSLTVCVDGLHDHLYLRSRGQSGDGERGACRRNLYLSDPIGIHLIHGLEIIDVIEQDLCEADVVPGEPGRFQQRVHLGQRARRLGFHIIARVRCDLPGKPDDAVGLHSRGIGSEHLAAGNFDALLVPHASPTGGTGLSRSLDRREKPRRCMERAPLTCWVLDHPAHMQLFARWVRAGRANDLLIVTRRPETEALLATKEGHLPDRKVLLVKRPAGLGLLPLGRELRAWNRVRMVRARLKRQRLIGYPIERVVSKGAPLELLAAKREGVGSRWYISDCEPNHLAHRLALNSATDVVLPSSWRVDLDRGFLDAVQERSHIRLHRLSGELPHCYLSEPHRSAREEDSLPRILYRKLVGGGIHDRDEHISAEPLLSDLGMQVLTIAENDPVSDPWGLPGMLAEFDGVLSESVTLAHEAIVQ